MPTVSIDGVEYPSYIDVAYADEYLNADLSRAEAWTAVSPDNKSRAVVSSTRLLQRLVWKAGPPAIETASEPVKQATALLAADIAAKPKLGDGASTGSNVKSVGAGSAKVEFFAPVEGQVLPSDAFDLLRGLLGQDDGALLGLDNTAYGSHPYQRSRFDETDYRHSGTGPLDERLWW